MSIDNNHALLLSPVSYSEEAHALLFGPWRQRALCRGTEPELFFPEKGDSKGVEEVRAICHACPVEETCLEFALVTHETHGVWGGTTERERRVLRRQRGGALAIRRSAGVGTKATAPQPEG